MGNVGQTKKISDSTCQVLHLVFPPQEGTVVLLQKRSIKLKLKSAKGSRSSGPSLFKFNFH